MEVLTKYLKGRLQVVEGMHTKMEMISRYLSWMEIGAASSTKEPDLMPHQMYAFGYISDK